MKKKVLALLFAVVLTLTCLAACSKQQESVSDAPFSADFTSVTLDGTEVTRDILKGNKVTMVNVWGTYCPPCIGEMPDLQKISEDFEKDGVKVVGIVIDVYDYYINETDSEMVAKAKEIIGGTGVKYQNILTSQSLIDSGLGSIYAVPTTYFFDENGNLLGDGYEGARSYEEWSTVINGFLS